MLSKYKDYSQEKLVPETSENREQRLLFLNSIVLQERDNIKKTISCSKIHSIQHFSFLFLCKNFTTLKYQLAAAKSRVGRSCLLLSVPIRLILNGIRVRVRVRPNPEAPRFDQGLPQ